MFNSKHHYSLLHSSQSNTAAPASVKRWVKSIIDHRSHWLIDWLIEGLNETSVNAVLSTAQVVAVDLITTQSHSLSEPITHTVTHTHTHTQRDTHTDCRCECCELVTLTIAVDRRCLNVDISELQRATSKATQTITASLYKQIADVAYYLPAYTWVLFYSSVVVVGRRM